MKSAYISLFSSKIQQATRGIPPCLKAAAWICKENELNPGQAVETTKLEYGRGKGNFQWTGGMHRDRSPCPTLNFSVIVKRQKTESNLFMKEQCQKISQNPFFEL